MTPEPYDDPDDPHDYQASSQQPFWPGPVEDLDVDDPDDFYDP